MKQLLHMEGVFCVLFIFNSSSTPKPSGVPAY